MWIAGGNKPDFRTINRFRLDMKNIIEDAFYEVILLLIEKNYIKLQNYFLDGTKIEANADKYTFVWNKAVQKHDQKLDEKIKNHLREIDRIVAEENHLGSYVKYNNFHWEKKKKNRENPYLSQNMQYDIQTDSFTCKNGKRLHHRGRYKYVTDAGYETRRDYYTCEDCCGCPYASECKKTEKNRTIQISQRLNELKKNANENLCYENGLQLRSQRVGEVEQTFGRIKGCWSFRRFHLRGKDKVKIEWGLLAIAHNITKMALEG